MSDETYVKFYPGVWKSRVSVPGAHSGHKLKIQLQNKLWNPLMQHVGEQKTVFFPEIQTS